MLAGIFRGWGFGRFCPDPSCRSAWLPTRRGRRPRDDQPINSEAGQETSIEDVVPADTRTRVAVIEAPDRSAEQGIWQEGANGISGARPDGRQKDASRFLITA